MTTCQSVLNSCRWHHKSVSESLCIHNWQREFNGSLHRSLPEPPLYSGVPWILGRQVGWLIGGLVVGSVATGAVSFFHSVVSAGWVKFSQDVMWQWGRAVFEGFVSTSFLRSCLIIYHIFFQRKLIENDVQPQRGRSATCGRHSQRWQLVTWQIYIRGITWNQNQMSSFQNWLITVRRF